MGRFEGNLNNSRQGGGTWIMKQGDQMFNKGPINGRHPEASICIRDKGEERTKDPVGGSKSRGSRNCILTRMRQWMEMGPPTLWWLSDAGIRILSRRWIKLCFCLPI